MYQRTLHRKLVHRGVRKNPEVSLGRPPGLWDQFGHKTGHWSPFQFFSVSNMKVTILEKVKKRCRGVQITTRKKNKINKFNTFYKDMN